MLGNDCMLLTTSGQRFSHYFGKNMQGNVISFTSLQTLNVRKHHFTAPNTPFSPSTSLKWNQSSLFFAVIGIAGCRSRKMRPLLLSGAKWSLRCASKIECDQTMGTLDLHMEVAITQHNSLFFATVLSHFQPDLPRYNRYNGVICPTKSIPKKWHGCRGSQVQHGGTHI